MTAEFSTYVENHENNDGARKNDPVGRTPDGRVDPRVAPGAQWRRTGVVAGLRRPFLRRCGRYCATTGRHSPGSQAEELRRFLAAADRRLPAVECNFPKG